MRVDGVELIVPAAAVTRLREAFVAVEGSCEAWADDEVVRRVLIRGAMDYAKSAGRQWDEVSALARELRAQFVAD